MSEARALQHIRKTMTFSYNYGGFTDLHRINSASSPDYTKIAIANIKNGGYRQGASSNSSNQHYYSNTSSNLPVVLSDELASAKATLKVHEDSIRDGSYSQALYSNDQEYNEYKQNRNNQYSSSKAQYMKPNGFVEGGTLTGKNDTVTGIAAKKDKSSTWGEIIRGKNGYAYGTQGNDLIEASSGDEIVSGKGRDVITCSGGEDWVWISKKNEGGKYNYDVIKGFEVGTDWLGIEGNAKGLYIDDRGNDAWIMNGRDIMAIIKGAADGVEWVKDSGTWWVG